MNKTDNYRVQQVKEEYSTNTVCRLQHWVIEIFNLPKETMVILNDYHYKRGENPSTATEITITIGKSHRQKYIINKPIRDLEHKDIKLLKESIESHVVKKHPILGRLVKFFGWWFGFSGLYAMFAVCPFCGQAGCPVGIGSAGVVGGFCAICMQNWKTFFQFIRSWLFRKSKPL